MSRHQTFHSAAILTTLLLCATAAPAARMFALDLADALPDGKTLTVLADTSTGVVVSAFAVAPTFNGRAHKVDATALAVTDDAITGPVTVTIIPDPWVPRDGKPKSCHYTLNAAISGGTLEGSFEGSYEGEQRHGTVTGRSLPAVGPAGRYKLRLFQAMRRLAPARGFRGPNADYALDMWLTFRINPDGSIRDAQLESPVPDYRRYSALVTQIDGTVEGSTFNLTVMADVDHGGQGQAQDASRHEVYTYELRGLAIGDSVGGVYDAKVGDIRDTDIPFVGRIDRVDPPSPDAAEAFMRMHNAMQNEYPVLLFLSVSDGTRIHGLAYAPGYNHQPQAVDATGLVRDGIRLSGPLTVSIYPDCYHDQDIRFDMTYRIDATLERGVIHGTFTGEDRGQPVQGRITGELRPHAPPIAPPDKLSAVEVTIGYAMPRAATKSIRLRYELAGGIPRRVMVLDARTEAPLAVEVGRHDLQIAGDRMTGSFSFTMEGEGGGHYEFTFSAVIDGDGCSGYWRGLCNGQPILVKSAKLGGRLEPAAKEDTE